MALGLAGSRAGSLSINTGTMTKSSHSGHAARMGVECAVLARMGWTASADVFGPKGFFDTFFGGRAEPLKLVEKIRATAAHGRSRRRLQETSEQLLHAPADRCGARAASGTRIDPAQIERVEVVFPRFDYVNRPFPETGLDGKFSVQYTTAVALLDGEVTIDSFTNERRFAPDVEALLPRVQLIVDDAIPNDFDRMHAIVSVTLKDRRALFAARGPALGLGRLAAHARAAPEEIPFVRAARARPALGEPRRRARGAARRAG